MRLGDSFHLFVLVFFFHSSKTLRSSSHHILIKKRVQHSATSDYSDYRYRNPFCLCQCEFTVSNFKYVKSKSKYAVCRFHADIAGLCFCFPERRRDI